MEKAAVIGHPIGHTMSPFIHKALFSLSGISCDYGVLDIKDLDADISALKGLDGFNITIPYKEKIIKYLDYLDDKARLFGSVNTVRVLHGKMTGYTTDGMGMRLAFEKAEKGLDGNILVLGSGGAARAIAFEIAYVNSGANITLIHRKNSKDKALKIKSEIGNAKIEIMDYDLLEKSDAEYDVLINATSVGMYPNTDFAPVSESVVRRCNTVFDAVYNPNSTRLLRYAVQSGKRVIYGIDMLVYQAVAAHEIWYGAAFDKADIKELCRLAKEETKRLFGV